MNEPLRYAVLAVALTIVAFGDLVWTCYLLQFEEMDNGYRRGRIIDDVN